MEIPRPLVWMTVPIALLVEIASGAGVFYPPVYARETASWAAQGYGQDIVTMIFAGPLLLISGYFVGKGSGRGLMVWLGVLIYVVYSYTLYSFFMHFGPMFPVYVAALMLSFYTLFGSILSLATGGFKGIEAPRSAGVIKTTSAFLFIAGVMFLFLWLSDIISNLRTGTIPAGALEIGFHVNPIHVMDLAFALPGMILTSVLLWKRKTLGFLLAVPCLVFLAVMGVALIAMMFSLKAAGLFAGGAGMYIVGAATVIGTCLSFLFMKETND